MQSVLKDFLLNITRLYSNSWVSTLDELIWNIQPETYSTYVYDHASGYTLNFTHQCFPKCEVTDAGLLLGLILYQYLIFKISWLLSIPVYFDTFTQRTCYNFSFTTLP